MQEILAVDVKIDNDQMVTTSKNMAAVFSKRHDHILRDIEELKKDLPNFGEMFYEIEIPDVYGRLQKAYEINRDGFTLLAMGFTGAKAIYWKLKYIEAFNKLESIYNSPEQIMAKALRLADKTIASLNQQIEQKDKVIEEQKPKALFADAVSASSTSILIGDLAKLICQNGVDIGQRRLFSWLRDKGYLVKSGDSMNMPMQRYIEQGLFEIKERTIQNPDGSVRITRTTKVTGKGQVYFVQKFLER